jgi:hypothetical protein
VAFAAVTVKVDELPEVIEVGFAMMLTVGAADELPVLSEFALYLTPQPMDTRRSKGLHISAIEQRMRERNRGTRTFIKVFSFLPSNEERWSVKLRRKLVRETWHVYLVTSPRSLPHHSALLPDEVSLCVVSLSRGPVEIAESVYV